MLEKIGYPPVLVTRIHPVHGFLDSSAGGRDSPNHGRQNKQPAMMILAHPPLDATA